MSDVTSDKAEGDRKEDDRKKRPDVQHYKPGAFKKQEPEELIPGFTYRREQKNRGGSRRSADSKRSGGGGGGGKKGKSEEPKADAVDDARKKKPEIEHYVPKKVQEKEDKTLEKEVSKVDEDKGLQDAGGGGGGGTGTRRKKRKGRHKDKDRPDSMVLSGAAGQNEKLEKTDGKKPAKSTESKGSNKEGSAKNDNLTSSLNDDLPARQIGKQSARPKDSGGRGKKDSEPKKSKGSERSSQSGEFSVPEPPVNRNRDPKSGSGSNRGGRSAGGHAESIEQLDWRSSEDSRGFMRRDRGGRGGFSRNNPHRWSQDMDYRRSGGHESFEEYGYNTWDNHGRSKGHKRGGRRGGGSRGSSPHRGNQGRGGGSRQGSPRGGRGGGSRQSSRQGSPARGGRGGSRHGSPHRGSRRWSRASSPSFSSRGNSPLRQRSKPNSGRSSPNFQHSRTTSPVRYTRVFRRNSSPQRVSQGRSGSPHRSTYGRNVSPHSQRTAYGRNRSPPSQRSTMSRTPSPGGRRSRDSRDLEGWSRGDTKRRQDGLWDPEGKPPSGRVKSAPVRTNLPPRFQKTKERDEARLQRLGESQVSDWSLEMDEEEERRSQLGISPPSGPGIIRVSESGPGPQWGPPPESQHPAWRTGPASWTQTLPANLDKQPSLFNPNNPMKPIRMPGEPSARDRMDQGFTEVGSLGSGARFPLGTSRFALPAHMFPPSISPGSGYQPPFPPSSLVQPRQQFYPGAQAPDWYDVYNTNIYENAKVDIKIIVRIVTADEKLRCLVRGGPSVICSRWNQGVKEARHDIMNAAWQLLKTDLFFVCERDVDTHIWKTVYHQVIEMLKMAFLDVENTTPETRQLLRSQLLHIFEEGVDYYNQLLKYIGEIYHLDLERFYDVLEPRDLSKTGRLALIAAQKVLLCLGDLARYKEQVNSTTNYGRARQHYLKANHLDMRNGRPFNMLAILAKMSNRKFEAVYYNIRCLKSRNPFLPVSKEGLNVIFDEMKRRWEANEKQKLDKKQEEEKAQTSACLIKGSRIRREIWIRGEDGRRLHRTTSATAGSESSSYDFDTLSITDLNKRFITTFLHMQGIFFTQINTEYFSVASESLLEQFRILIGKSPLPISLDRLVQIMALNMYSIEKTKMRACSESPTYRSVMQTRALELAGDMFAILLERCNLLIAAMESPEAMLSTQFHRQEDLIPLLAAVKVWCDWLIGNNDTWYPVVSAEPFTQLAQLATRLEATRPSVSRILEQCLSDETWTALPQARRAEFEIIRLTEDAILCEFEPWFRGLEWSTYRQFHPRSINQQSAQNAKRIDQIRMCAEVLEGLDPPVLKWSVPDNSHVCLVTDRDESTQASVARDMAEANLTALIARDEDILEESYSDKEDVDDDFEQDNEALSDEIAKLRLRKVELEKVQTEQARRAQREILDQHVRTTLEVRPKIVVPDTNEFIDHLDIIKRLAALGDLQIRVPLVVLGELEGLSKSRDNTDRPEHASMLRDNSKSALAWIKEKPTNVKCVTTKGSILTSLGVTVEEDTEAGLNNDDRILSCCLNLDASPAPTTVDGMKTVFRTAVLLTDDRNLKLKAHIKDCAVSKIGDFMSWISEQP